MEAANPMDSLVSIAASISTPSTKRRIQIFSNEIPFLLTNIPSYSGHVYVYLSYIYILPLLIELLFYRSSNVLHNAWFVWTIGKIVIWTVNCNIFLIVCIQFCLKARPQFIWIFGQYYEEPEVCVETSKRSDIMEQKWDNVADSLIGEAYFFWMKFVWKTFCIIHCSNIFDVMNVSRMINVVAKCVQE